MIHAIDLLESKLKEKTEEINFSLRNRHISDIIRKNTLEAINAARSYKDAIKILKGNELTVKEIQDIIIQKVAHYGYTGAAVQFSAEEIKRQLKKN